MMPLVVRCCSRARRALCTFWCCQVCGCFLQALPFVVGWFSESLEFCSIRPEDPALTVTIRIHPAATTPGAQRCTLDSKVLGKGCQGPVLFVLSEEGQVDALAAEPEAQRTHDRRCEFPSGRSTVAGGIQTRRDDAVAASAAFEVDDLSADFVRRLQLVEAAHGATDLVVAFESTVPVEAHADAFALTDNLDGHVIDERAKDGLPIDARRCRQVPQSGNVVGQRPNRGGLVGRQSGGLALTEAIQ